MTTYTAILNRLYGLSRVGEKYSLDGPRRLNQRLGNPLGAYDSILVGGTNGKGSTTTMLAHLLHCSGTRVGLFRSPHLLTFRERIQINGNLISEELLVSLAPEVCAIAEAEQHSFFEAVWALAARAFERSGVDVVVWEVGLGGRLDATNVCEPIGAIVTNVELDHTAILGPTRVEIGKEKAAIFRPGVPALTGSVDALGYLQPHTDARIRYVPTDANLDVGLDGIHQQQNASVVIALVEALGLPHDRADLSTVSFVGRLHRIGPMIVDCAHNPAALEATFQAVMGTDSSVVDYEIAFGVMADKNVEEMIRCIRETNCPVHLLEPIYPRRLGLDALRSLSDTLDIRSAGTVDSFLKLLDSNRRYLVVGSAFLAAEVLAKYQEMPYPECGILTLAR